MSENSARESITNKLENTRETINEAIPGYKKFKESETDTQSQLNS